MRIIALITLLLAGIASYAQDTVHVVSMPKGAVIHHIPFVAKSTIFSLGIGFIDNYRNGYTYPKGYEKKTIAGFCPVTARLEYGLSPKISIAGALTYDAFTNNYYQVIESNSATLKRVIADNVRVFSASAGVYYHFSTAPAKAKRFDPYLGVGIAANNYSQTAFPQGDSTVHRTDHPITLFAKVGTRYFITDQSSLFLEAGYDKTSIVNLGFSCRFFKKE